MAPLPRSLGRTARADQHVGPLRARITWFTADIDPHKLLLSHDAGRWDLLVMPPETGAKATARLLAAASDHDGPTLTASALIAADEARYGVTATDGPLDHGGHFP
ncbi:hypothetical protein SBD_5212 [Streptomyces bottropensis ATCC 25435]|uniref:Uncharacterized protein n=1 Tax=Streptomyces bottropensis ATCC 25435 TaxID=1054862 RepID=M3EX14_9ACTN|nr:hypothetical protein SBD_5212 [Streptomyces bottropensis ATCC 25435]